MIEDYNLVSFVPLDITTEDGYDDNGILAVILRFWIAIGLVAKKVRFGLRRIESVLMHIDLATQFGEDAEVQDRDFNNDSQYDFGDNGMEY